MNVTKLAEEYGVKNLRFFTAMPTQQFVGIISGIAIEGDESSLAITECTVDESAYKVADGYKITLKAVDSDYGRNSFYISDLNTLIHADQVVVCVVTEDGYQKVS